MLFDIRNYGAVAGCPATERIQAAIDAASKSGGEVLIPRGEWRVGTVWLRSGVTLRLASGAHLIGSKNPDDYGSIPSDIRMKKPSYPCVEDGHTNVFSRWNNAIIRALGEENIAIIGEEGSVIDGVNCYDSLGEEGYRGPHGISLSTCRGVYLSGYTVRDSGNWAHNIVATENLKIENVTVLGGHDGIDVFVCKNVDITDCELHTGDDCIAGYGSLGVRVKNCRFSTACSILRFGGTDVTVTDCRQTSPARFGHRLSLTDEDKISGATSEGVGRRNTLTAFLYYGDYRFTPLAVAGNITLENMELDSVDAMFHLNYGNHKWCSGSPLSSITFRNCVIRDISESTYVYADDNVPFTLTLDGVELHARHDCGAEAVINGAKFAKIEMRGVRFFGFDAPTVLTSCEGEVRATDTDAFKLVSVPYVLNENSK